MEDIASYLNQRMDQLLTLFVPPRALGLNQVLFNWALGHPALPSFKEGFAVTGVSLYLLLPRFGFVGPAVSSTLAYVSSLIFTLVLCRARA